MASDFPADRATALGVPFVDGGHRDLQEGSQILDSHHLFRVLIGS